MSFDLYYSKNRKLTLNLHKKQLHILISIIPNNVIFVIISHYCYHFGILFNSHVNAMYFRYKVFRLHCRNMCVCVLCDLTKKYYEILITPPPSILKTGSAQGKSQTPIDSWRSQKLIITYDMSVGRIRVIIPFFLNTLNRCSRLLTKHLFILCFNMFKLGSYISGYFPKSYNFYMHIRVKINEFL